MRKPKMSERKEVYNTPARELKEDAELVIHNGKLVGVDK
jgi:hypothetical protein